MEYYLAAKMNELLLFAITWMDRTVISLSEESSLGLHPVWFHLHDILNHSDREQTIGCQGLRVMPEYQHKKVTRGSIGRSRDVLYADGGSDYSKLNMG